MKANQWSQEEIEEYSRNMNLLYSKANELSNETLKDYVNQTISTIKSHLNNFLYRITHFGHRPQLR